MPGIHRDGRIGGFLKKETKKLLLTTLYAEHKNVYNKRRSVMFKCSQTEVASKDFHKKTQITDIFMIDVNKVLLSDKMPCNNGRDWRYILGYEVDGERIMPLSIKTPKNIFNYGVSQYDKKSTYTISFHVSEAPEWVLQYRNITNEVTSKLFGKLATGPIKGEVSVSIVS